MTFLKNSFNAGELGDLLRYRIDLSKYASGVAAPLENFWVLPYGGIENRPGTEFICACYDETHPVRILPFRFSATETAVLEFGEHYLRVAGTDVVLETPYSGSEVFQLNFCQSLDMVFLVHGNHAPRILKRYGPEEWALELMELKSRPWQDANTEERTMTAAAVSGESVELTASSDFFDSAMAGMRIRLEHNRSSNSVLKTFTGNGSGTPFSVKGAWTFRSSGSWVGTLHLQKSFDHGESWEEFRIYPANADDNADDSGFEEDPGVLYRASFTGWTAAPEGVLYECRTVLKADSYYHTGEAEIVSVTDAAHAQCRVIAPFYSTDPTEHFQLEAWSDYTGYPKHVLFHSGDRLVFAATERQPQHLWFSAVGDYNHLEPDTRADSAMAMKIHSGEYNEIRWMVNRKHLLLGMANGVGVVSAPDENEALSVENIRYELELETGAADAGAITVNDTVLFLRRGSRQLMELSYNWESDGYLAPDMTLLAPDILGDGAPSLHFRSLPYPLVFLPRSDGRMACFTYNRAEEVTAWSRMTTDGAFESVAVVPSDGTDDEVYFVVNRNGRRFLEKLARREDSAFGCFLDSSVHFGEGEEVCVPHLAGRTVSAVIDGGAVHDLTVDAEGGVTLPESGKEIRIGLPYVSSMTTLPLELMQGTDSTLAEKKRIPGIMLKFYRSLGGSVSVCDGAECVLVRRRTGDVLGRQLDPETGSYEIYPPNRYRYEVTISVFQREPLPLTLTAMVAEFP